MILLCNSCEKIHPLDKLIEAYPILFVIGIISIVAIPIILSYFICKWKGYTGWGIGEY